MSKIFSIMKLSKQQLIKRFRFSPKLDSYVISYRKSGRTWLKALIGKYLSLKYELSEDLVLSPEDVSENSGLPRLFISHAGTGLGADENPDSDLCVRKKQATVPKCNPARTRNKRYSCVLLFPRDPKVVCF